MDHGERVDKNRRAGIQIIDQSRDENKLKDLDKHQAVRAQADGRPPLEYLQRLSDLKRDAPVALGRLIDDLAQANKKFCQSSLI